MDAEEQFSKRKIERNWKFLAEDELSALTLTSAEMLNTSPN